MQDDSISIAQYLSQPRSSPADNPFQKKVFARQRTKQSNTFHQHSSCFEQPPTSFQSLKAKPQSFTLSPIPEPKQEPQSSKIDRIFDLLVDRVQSQRQKCRDMLRKEVGIMTLQGGEIDQSRFKIGLNRNAFERIEEAMSELCEIRCDGGRALGIGQENRENRGCSPKSLPMPTPGQPRRNSKVASPRLQAKESLYKQVLRKRPR